MSLPRSPYWLFSLALLAFLLSWGWVAEYRTENKKVEDKIEQFTQLTATQLQNINLSLNNLAGSLDDKDHSSKIAFAIGMTQNRAKLSITFDDVKDTASKNVPHIDRKWLETNHIKFIPAAVKTIPFFDSLLTASLHNDHINITFYTQKITSHILLPVSHSSGLFIIDFYNPVVYRVVYSIPVWLVLRHMLPYSVTCLLLLTLLSAAFILYHRSYHLQMQMAQFKENLFSNVIHELKTPLASLQLIIDSFREQHITLSAKQNEYVDFAGRELSRMKLLVEKILSFGKLDAEQFQLNKEAMLLSPLIKEAIDIMAVMAGNKNAQIKFHQSEDVTVVGDRVLLLNTLLNIIDNAIKYNGTMPCIDISLKQHDGLAYITLQDNGIGIQSQYYRKIFDPFFRIPTGNEHAVKGHGLGLSFTMQVLTLHSGKVTVSSETGKGSTFIITLPAL